MQIKNNYKLEWEVVGNYNLVLQKGQGVFNGDIGIIKEINEYASLILVEFDEGRWVHYRFEELDELELAYCSLFPFSAGLIKRCKIPFNASTPTAPFFMGVSTWISKGEAPTYLGSLSVTSWTMLLYIISESFLFRK